MRLIRQKKKNLILKWIEALKISITNALSKKELTKQQEKEYNMSIFSIIIFIGLLANVLKTLTKNSN